MTVCNIEVQRINVSSWVPSDEELQLWAEKALIDYQQDTEIVIRVVDIQEMSGLNQQYRHKTGPTNILSFPFEVPEGIEGLDLLGDLVVCSEVLEGEAKAQNKKLKDHWAHIIIHGILHLTGYDHINKADALEMEAKEVYLLQQLMIDNPYQEKEVNG